MMKPLLLLAVIFFCVVPATATTWYARLDGGTTTQCLGTTDAPYDGSGTGEACAYASLQNAVNAVVAGDTVIARAGDTWDGVLLLPNRSCTAGSPCRLISSNLALLPSGRVGPANATNMPRIRTTGGSGISASLEWAANADYWTVDGFEITDNAGTADLQTLVDLGLTGTGADNNTIQRCYIHQKETGVNYERSANRGIWNEGNNNTIKWNYVGPFIGYYYGQLDGTPFLSAAYFNVGASTDNLVEDNFLDAWYATLFTGGGDPAPTHSSAMSAATTTQATLSDVTGITPGVMLRFELHFTATVASTGAQTATLTRTSGATLVSPGDVAVIASDIYRGAIVFPTSGTTAVADITNITGDVYTVLYATSSTKPADGSWPCVMYKTALVDSVAGNVVNYTPYETGYSAINQNPNLSNVSWCAVGECNTANLIIRKNTIHIDPAFELYNLLNGNGSGPKGFFEFKSAYNMTLDGNRFEGGPSGFSFTGNNQNGTAPWPTVQNVTISNNFFVPDYVSSDYVAQAFIMTINPYKTTAPGKNITITNNFFSNISVMGVLHTFDNVLINHNTIINNVGSSGGGYNALFAGIRPATNFVFKDNIGFYSNGGMSCQLPPNTLATCWPSGIFLNNVAVDNTAQGFGTTVWGAGSVLSPIGTTLASIGLLDSTTCLTGTVANCALAGASNYKNDASDGSDPGVNAATLAAALGPQGAASTSISGKVVVTGKVTAQ